MKTRKEKREEENKIMAQIQESLPSDHAEERQAKSPNGENGKYGNTYTPMDEKTARKIRWILGGILLIVFVVIVIVNKIA